MTDNLNPDPVPPSPTPPGAVPPGVSPLGYTPSADAGPIYVGAAPEQDSRTMGMLAHLLGIFTWWIGPLIIWLVKKDTSPFVNDQGKEALNWQITLFIAWFVLFIPRFFLPWFIGCFLSILVLGIVIVNIIFAIQGAIAANKGVAYRYPFSLRLIK